MNHPMVPGKGPLRFARRFIMFDTMLQYTAPGVTRPLITWPRMLDLIHSRTSMYTEAMIQGSKSVPPWVTKVRKVLSAIPADSWLSMEPTKRYATALMHADSDLLMGFCPNYTIPTLTNNFIAVNNASIHVQEYLVPVRSPYPLMNLPLGRNIDQWKDVHPLMMLYNDSPELSGNIYKMQYTYKSKYPSMIIMAIDIPSLVFKYLAYVEDCNTKKKPVVQTDFIHKHLMDNFYDDCVRCWIFQLFNLKLERMEIPPTPGLIIDPGVVELALRDIDTYYDKVRSKNIGVGDFLKIEWLPGTPHQSIMDYLDWYQEHITFLDYRQAKYLEFFVQFPVVYFMMHLYDMCDRPNDRMVKKQLYIQLDRMYRSGVLDMCHNQKLRRRIHRNMRELLDLSRPDEYSLRPD